MTPYVEPPRRPITLWRGDNTPPVQWEFLNSDGTPVDLNGSTFVLRFGWFGHSLSFSSANGDLSINASAGVVSWNYDSNTSMSFPYGPEIDYQLQRVISNTVQTWTYGSLDVRGPL